MTKIFVYEVAGFEWRDTEAFGTAWKQARAEAEARKCGIYRLVIKGEQVKQEVLVRGGCFLPVEMVKPDEVLIFPR